jgi:osmotically-inducible protein OsmY
LSIEEATSMADEEHEPRPDGKDQPDPSEQVSDYLQSLRARFDALTDRIDEATRASIDRNQQALAATVAGEAATSVEPEPQVAPVADGGDTGGAARPLVVPRPIERDEPAERPPGVADGGNGGEGGLPEHRLGAVTARDLPRPVVSRTGSRAWLVIALSLLLIGATAFLAGRWWTTRGETTAAGAPETGQTAPLTITPATATDEEIHEAAIAAITGLGLRDVQVGSTIAVTVSGGTVRLEGSVADEVTRDRIAGAVLEVGGATQLDNRLTVDAPAPLGPDELPAAVETALATTGFEHLAVAVDGATATVSGVVPVDALDAGLFAYLAPLRSALLAIPGIEAVATRVQVMGDEEEMAADLDELVAAQPVSFALGAVELDAAGTAALDEVAAIIRAYPGLRVLVAGPGDPAGSAAENEQLAAARAQVVVGYLVQAGIPAARLQVVPFVESAPGEEDPGAVATLGLEVSR